MLSANLRLQELNTGRKARVVTAVKMAKHHLFQYQGYIGAYLLIGGVDFTGPHLYDVSASGNDMHLPFAADGSGSYCAMAILERDYKLGMSVSRFHVVKRFLFPFRSMRVRIWFDVLSKQECTATTSLETRTISRS